MPKKTIAVGQQIQITTPGLFLSIINTTSQFHIESPDFGVLIGKVGRQYELPNTNRVMLVNTGEDPVEIEYEVANIKVHGAGNGTVTVENEVVVKRIQEALSFEATIDTLNDGKVRAIRANVINTLDDITIPSGQKVKIIDANDVTNRVVSIQNISDTVTALRVGSTDVAAGKGKLMRGSINAIAETVIENTAEIYIHNTSGDVAKVSVTEEYRP